MVPPGGRGRVIAHFQHVVPEKGAVIVGAHRATVRLASHPEGPSAARPPRRPSWLGRAWDALRDPAYRSGYALVANTVGTTVVGMAYWAVAARLYGEQAVGRASALVAALILVSSIAQLNLANTLPRFMPEVGRQAGRLVRYGYALASAAAAVAGMAFVVILPRFSSQWRFLGSSPLLAVAFVAGVVVWGVFALQDAALLGLHRPVMVPLENTVYGVAKLIALLAVASALPGSGIFVSWVTPLVIVVPAVNWLIFRRYLPDRGSAAAPASVRPREIVRFTSIDFAGSLLGQAYGNLLPLLVLSVLGAAANAGFYIAWTIATGLELVATNFATSLLVEGSAAPHRLAELTRGTLARSLLVTTSGAAVLGLAPRLVLSVYGHGYAARAALDLALLSAGTVLYGLLTIAFSLDRIAGRVGRATLTRLALAVLVLAGSWVLLRRVGIDGVGFAWLGANVLVTAARIPAIVRAAWPRHALAPGGRQQDARLPPQRRAGAHRRGLPGRHRAVTSRGARHGPVLDGAQPPGAAPPARAPRSRRPAGAPGHRQAAPSAAREADEPAFRVLPAVHRRPC
jgi:O-antigen/teichoic acid export membrane protein